MNISSLSPGDTVFVLASDCIQLGCVTELRSTRTIHGEERFAIVECLDKSCPEGFSRGLFSGEQLMQAEAYESYGSASRAWIDGIGHEAFAFALGVKKRLEQEAEEKKRREQEAIAAERAAAEAAAEKATSDEAAQRAA